MDLKTFKRLIRPITNKIFLLLGRAIVKAIDNTTDTQTIQVTALSDETISEIERFQEYGFETYPWNDAESFIGFLNGNRDHGIALVVHDLRYRPTDLSQGEIALYTDEDSTNTFRIWLKRNRILSIQNDKHQVTADTEAYINSPQVSLGGASFAALRTLIDSRFVALYNAHTHGGGAVPDVAMSEANHATSKVKAI